jgi:branched-chain amino acid transport system permease protein
VLIGLAIAVWLSLPLLFPGHGTVLVVMALYVPIVVGIALLAGYTGQVSLGQAAFFGIGAYGTGILTVHAGLSPWLAMPVAAAAAGVAAVVIGAPIFLLRGQYLVLATLGLNIIFVVVVGQLGVTGGASGLVGIPPLSIGGTTFLGAEFFFYAGSALALAAMVLSSWLIRSRIGRALQAIEGSETAAATLGISRRRHTTEVFAWSAVLAGASGGLYAEWLQFISPSTFSLDVSIELLIMAVIGGIASVPGALVGVVVVLSLRETLREFAPGIAGATGSGTASAEYELILFGILLTAVVILMPEGVWPRLASFTRARLRAADRRTSGPDPAEAVSTLSPPAPVAPVERPLDRHQAPLVPPMVSRVASEE